MKGEELAMAEMSCGDDSCQVLVSPIPRLKVQSLAVCRPRARRVRLVDSNKPNSLGILTRTKALLEARGVAAEVDKKGPASLPMDEELLKRLSTERGLVLVGVLD